MPKQKIVRGTTASRSAPSQLVTEDVGYITGGYSSEVIEEHGGRDGAAGILNTLLWGANAFSHGFELLRGALIAGLALIAHAYVNEALDLWGQFLEVRGAARASKRETITAAREWRRTAFHRIAVGKHIEDAGFTLPVRSDRIKHAIGLTLLYLGELGLIATAFQILSLSDRPNIPGIPITDDLHLAALASGTAIMVCAHMVGHNLQAIKAAITADERTPRRLWFATGVAIGAGLFAIGAVFALNQIRISYLTALNVGVDWWPFLLLQLVLLGAGIFLSYRYAVPDASQYSAAVRAEGEARRAAEAAHRNHENLVAKANAMLERVVRSHDLANHHGDAMKGQAAQHNAVYEQAALRNTPEPVEAFMFTLRSPSPFDDPKSSLPKVHEDTKVDARALSSDAVSAEMRRVSKAIAKAERTFSKEERPGKESMRKKTAKQPDIDEEFQEMQADQPPTEPRL